MRIPGPVRPISPVIPVSRSLPHFGGWFLPDFFESADWQVPRDRIREKVPATVRYWAVPILLASVIGFYGWKALSNPDAKDTLRPWMARLFPELQFFNRQLKDIHGLYNGHLQGTRIYEFTKAGKVFRVAVDFNLKPADPSFPGYDRLVGERLGPTGDIVSFEERDQETVKGLFPGVFNPSVRDQLEFGPAVRIGLNTDFDKQVVPLLSDLEKQVVPKEDIHPRVYLPIPASLLKQLTGKAVATVNTTDSQVLSVVLTGARLHQIR